jgi:endonuclease G
VKVPRRYWKVVVAREGNELESFAFVLKQSLRGVRFREFDVRDRELKDGMISISDLESLLQNSIKFPRAVRDADQIGTQRGRELRELHSVIRFD